MGYYVEYDPQLKRRYPLKIVKHRQMSIKLMVLMGMAVMTYVLIKTDALTYLVPGDRAITTAAFNAMVEQVSDGIPVRDAVVGFIKDVVIGGLN